MINNQTIYAIDDDAAVLMSLVEVVRSRGYEVKGYLSAEEFLQEAKLEQPGCVIADWQMPNIDGLDLQQRLLNANSPLALVIVSGAVNVSAAVRFMEHGAVTLLEKPYRTDLLVSAIERALAISNANWQQRESLDDLRAHLATLTDEEKAVMELMIVDEPNKSIAHRLDLSMRTIDRRRRGVLEKMGVQSVPELAAKLARLKAAGNLA